MKDYFKRFLVLKKISGKDNCTVKLEENLNDVKISVEIFSNDFSSYEYIFVYSAFGEEIKTFNCNSLRFELSVGKGAERGFSAVVLDKDKTPILYGSYGEAYPLNYLVSKADLTEPYNDDVIATENYFEVESEKQSFYNQDGCGDCRDKKSQTQEKEEGGTLLYEDVDRGCKQENYYLSIKEKLDGIISEHERDYALSSLIPKSTFAKINYDEGRFYSVGKVLEGEDIKYVCYAVKGSYSDAPPALISFCEFIPLSPFNPLAEGYYVIFQRADTGEIVKKPN